MMGILRHICLTMGSSPHRFILFSGEDTAEAFDCARLRSDSLDFDRALIIPPIPLHISPCWIPGTLKSSHHLLSPHYPSLPSHFFCVLVRFCVVCFLQRLFSASAEIRKYKKMQISGKCNKCGKRGNVKNAKHAEIRRMWKCNSESVCRSVFIVLYPSNFYPYQGRLTPDHPWSMVVQKMKKGMDRVMRSKEKV